MPVSGTFNVAAGDMLLTFDQPLEPGSFFDPDWTLRANAHEHDTDEITVGVGTPLLVEGAFSQTDPAAPLDAISYNGLDATFKGQNGLLVAAFTEFPLTLI